MKNVAGNRVKNQADNNALSKLTENQCYPFYFLLFSDLDRYICSNTAEKLNGSAVFAVIFNIGGKGYFLFIYVAAKILFDGLSDLGGCHRSEEPSV